MRHPREYPSHSMVILLPIREQLPTFYHLAVEMATHRHMTVEAVTRWRDYAASWITQIVNANLGFDAVAGYSEPLSRPYDGEYHQQLLELGFEKRFLSVMQMVLMQRSVDITDRIHVSVLDNALELYIPYSAALKTS